MDEQQTSVITMWTKLSELGVEYGLRLLGAIVIFFIGKWIVRVLSRLADRALTRANAEATLATFFRNVVYYGGLVFVFLTALGQLGVQTTSFVALIGAAGLAVGLALQGALSNFAAGVLIILFRPFRVGDYVETKDMKGTITEIQIFTTILRAPDNRTVIAPNASLTSGVVTVGKPTA